MSPITASHHAAVAPSPAELTRCLVLPSRASPAAKTPGFAGLERRIRPDQSPLIQIHHPSKEAGVWLPADEDEGAARTRFPLLAASVVPQQHHRGSPIPAELSESPLVEDVNPGIGQRLLQRDLAGDEPGDEDL